MVVVVARGGGGRALPRTRRPRSSTGSPWLRGSSSNAAPQWSAQSSTATRSTAPPSPRVRKVSQRMRSKVVASEAFAWLTAACWVSCAPSGDQLVRVRVRVRV